AVLHFFTRAAHVFEILADLRVVADPSIVESSMTAVVDARMASEVMAIIASVPPGMVRASAMVIPSAATRVVMSVMLIPASMVVAPLLHSPTVIVVCIRNHG